MIIPTVELLLDRELVLGRELLLLLLAAIGSNESAKEKKEKRRLNGS